METVLGAVIVLLPIDGEKSVHTAPTTLGVLIDTLCIEPFVMVAHPPINIDVRTSACQRMTVCAPRLPRITIGERIMRRPEELVCCTASTPRV